MPTNNIFASMLNQKPVSAPTMDTAGVIKAKKPNTPEFAYLSGHNQEMHPMTDGGNAVSRSVWKTILGMKPKGAPNV